MEAAGVDRILSVDLHSGQIQGQFQHCPVDNLSMFEDFAAFFVKHLLPTFPEGSEVAVVSPDADGTARAKFFLGLLIERGECDGKPARPVTLISIFLALSRKTQELSFSGRSSFEAALCLTLPRFIHMLHLVRRGKRLGFRVYGAIHSYVSPRQAWKTCLGFRVWGAIHSYVSPRQAWKTFRLPSQSGRPLLQAST